MERKEKLDVREGVGWAVLMLRSWCAVSLVRCWSRCYPFASWDILIMLTLMLFGPRVLLIVYRDRLLHTHSSIPFDHWSPGIVTVAGVCGLYIL